MYITGSSLGSDNARAGSFQSSEYHMVGDQGVDDMQGNESLAPSSITVRDVINVSARPFFGVFV
jgi:hypothetical protein